MPMQPGQSQGQKPKNAKSMVTDFASEIGNNFILQILSQAMQGGRGQSQGPAQPPYDQIPPMQPGVGANNFPGANNFGAMAPSPASAMQPNPMMNMQFLMRALLQRGMIR